MGWVGRVEFYAITPPNIQSQYFHPLVYCRANVRVSKAGKYDQDYSFGEE